MPRFSPEQLAQRRKSLGASDAPSLVGEGFLTLLQLWELKTGRRAPMAPTVDTERGHDLEPMVVAHYAARHPGSTVLEPLPLTGTHPDHAWATASPDGVVLTPEGEWIGLEAKTVGLRARRLWRTGYPARVFVQCQWSMAVYGYARWDLGALFEGPPGEWTDYRGWTIHRNDDLIKALLATGGRFWTRNVLADRPPRRPWRTR